MSGYMPAEALLSTLLQTISGLVVTEGDQRILDGNGESIAILFPASVPNYDFDAMLRQHEWECELDLFVRFHDVTGYTTLGTLRDSVIALLDTTKCLSATYFILSIQSSDDPAPLYNKQSMPGALPVFITQSFRIVIEEQV